MKLSVQPRPVAVDQDGNEVDLSTEILVEKVPVRLILSPNDIVPFRAQAQGRVVNAEPLSHFITSLVHEAIGRSERSQSKNFYWELGLALRSITCEENAGILVEALTKGETFR